MSGMLHPVGPEPARTYWVRRGILLAVVLVVLLGVVLAVASLTKSAVATAPPPVIAPVDTPSPTPSTSLGTPTAGVQPTTSGTPSAATSASPAVSGSPQPSSTAGSVPAASPSGSTAGGPSTAPSSQPTPTPTAKATPAGTPDCRPGDLDVTLKGERSLKPGENNTFKLAVANGGAQTCLASVTDKNFELKIYSGKDRIWSSQDCVKALKDFDKKLASKADVAWTMTWNGERSVAGKSCKTGSDTPRPGTYWATAQLTGADPVQLRMIIS